MSPVNGLSVSVAGRRYTATDTHLINMYTSAILVTLITFGVSNASYVPSPICFPKHFMFGVSTAAYQIEGAWNASGKGESIWDRFTHERPNLVFDHKNGDVATDSYHLFKEDVRIMKELGISFYRFSISWPRILPTGLSNEVNEDGIKHYSEVLNELRRNNIQSLVTMYHWDLPQALQDLGGWTNPIIADYFLDYARVLFDHFGDKVSSWLTFNEPWSFCRGGYGGIEAPGVGESGLEDYMCAHTVLRAHGAVYRMYEKEYRDKVGAVGISLYFPWYEAATTSSEDQTAAETVRQFNFGWYAHPIFSHEGDYPPIMRKRIDAISRRQHFTRSRLPTFTPNEIKMIKGSSDFLGLNHYTTYLVTKNKDKISSLPSFEADMGGKLSQKSEWPPSNSSWLKVVPWGFRKALNWIKNKYDNPLVLVTENGISLEKGLQDVRRINYIDAYLRSLHAAITKDKCQVLGYSYWSLMDDFEWTRGFSERFGLYEVDYESPNKTRTARRSASYFSHLARSGCLPSTEGFTA